MSVLELPGDIGVAFSHLAAVGLASIVEGAGAERVTLSWSASLDARAIVSAVGLDWDVAARIVHAHAVAHAEAGDWTGATVPGTAAGLLSPRIKVPADDDAWVALTAARRVAIDEQLRAGRWLDLALIGALGEPAHWRFDTQHARRPDEGASRWEMKTRNRGEDFVVHRLRKLAIAIAARKVDAIRDGLSGASLADEHGGNAVDSRTATGLAAPGPVDNALAWCALWGISAFPVIPRVTRPSLTAGHLSRRRAGGGPREDWFYLPVPSRPIRLARYRHVATSDQLATMAISAIESEADTLDGEAARAWLAVRHIGGIVRFPIGVYGSASAPERRTLLGTVDRVRR